MFHPANSRPGRRKLFTDGRQDPLNREDRSRLMRLADEARRRGNVSRSAVDVMRALVFRFANMLDGRCIPAHATIAAAAGCCTRTVQRCLADLEEAGLVTWLHRIRRIKEVVGGVLVRRVVRDSNVYGFPSAKNPAFSTDGHFDRGSRIPVSKKVSAPPPTVSRPELEADDDLFGRLMRVGHAPLARR